MNSVNLKEEVQKALDAEWPAFAERHPALAKVIDRTVLAEEAGRCLDADPEYRAALDAAATAGTMANAAVDLISKAVQALLARLAG